MDAGQLKSRPRNNSERQVNNIERQVKIPR